MRQAVLITLLAGCTSTIGCSDAPSTSARATPPANAQSGAPVKPDPLKAFEATPFCKQFGCERGKSWPLRDGGTNNTYRLTAASDTTVEAPTKDGAIGHYGLSFYERDRLRDQDLQVVHGLLVSLDPSGGSETIRHFIRANVERPAEQIRRGRSSRVGPFTVWAAKVGGTQIVSVERASGPSTSGAPLPLPAQNAASVPADFRELWTQAASGGKAGKHGAYTYQYAASGDRAAAIMIPRPIPRDDAILVATISDLTQRVFKADVSSATPRLAPTPHGNAIAFTVPLYTYYVLTMKNETREGAYGPGEPHTLLVWREGR